MEDSIVVWLPSIGVTGMTFYTGSSFPRWTRNVFVGGLREGGIPGTGQIQRIVFNELFLVPLTRFPGFAWLIAVGLASPNTIERTAPATGERVVRDKVA